MGRFLRRWLFGLGGIFQNLQNAPLFVVSPIYNIGLGVSPVLIGVAMALPRFWEIFFDPWIGRRSDRTVSRFGRRRPYILGGSTVGILFFIALWWVPFGWSREMQGFWLIALMLLFYTAYSVFTVPFAAFTIEVVRGDESERLRLNGAVTSLANLSAIPMGWLYWVCERPFFSNPVEGMRYVGLVFGLIVGACAVTSALVYREPPPFVPEKADAKPAAPALPLKDLLRVRPFQLLILAIFSLTFGFSLVIQLGFYVLAYYACRGDMHVASYIQGLSFTLRGVLGALIAWGAALLARHIGRRQALLPCLGVGCVGNLSMWWTLNPHHPYYYVASSALVTFPNAAFWTIVPALTGTISDDIEKRTGLACQGLISAIAGISAKISLTITYLLTGYVMLFCGFDVALPLASMGLSLERMRVVYALLPCIGMVVAAGSVWYCRVSTGPLRQSIRE